MTNLSDPMRRVVQKIDPAATVVRSWELKGGISAQMTALEVALGDGTRQKWVVRRPNARTLQLNPTAAADEFRILEAVQAAGVKTQRPYWLDETGEIFPTPYLVVEYIEGAPHYAPADPVAFAIQVADQLAKLHAITVTNAPFDLTHLPEQAQQIAAKLRQVPPTLDADLQEGRIRTALEAAWPLPPSGEDVLLHGDFWPGNLLWDAGQLVAVIDWEDALVGNALADFATTRLDMLWIFGRAAMDAFSARYRALSRLDFTTLPYWDLYAALRPAGRLAVWAEGWPELGRPDITEATMLAAHKWFVEQAFGQLEGR